MKREAAAPDYKESLVSELFHENSKHHRSDGRVADRIVAAIGSPELQRMFASSDKRYPSAPTIALPDVVPASERTFDDAVLTRRSSRAFSGAPISFDMLAKLTRYAGGVTGSVYLPGGGVQRFRVCPSGGALYPVELYVIANLVDNLPKALYHYCPSVDRLELVRGGIGADALVEITFTPELRAAAVVFALTGISVKSRLKYGERGYRFVLLEAGHIAQNILLTASAMNLAACAIGGFIDDELDALLDIDGCDETSLYMVAVAAPVEDSNAR